MQSRFIFLLAWRYLRGSAIQKSTKVMMMIAIGTIFFSTCALALTVAIMTGFQQATLRTLQGIHANVIISVPSTMAIHSYDHLISRIEENKTIVAYSPNYYAHALLENNQDSLGSLLLLQGINPKQEIQTTALDSFIQDKHAFKNLTGNRVIIGHRLAEKNNLQPGDSFQLLYVPLHQMEKKQLKLDVATVVITTFIKTGIEELDSSLVLMNYELFTDLWPDTLPATLSIKFNASQSESTMISALKKQLQLPVHAWYELYPSLLAALKLETFISTFVLALFSILASVIIGALIFMLITQKQLDIALLRAMGAKPKFIKKIFFLLGSLVTSSAALVGIVCAYGIGWFIKNYAPISLPDIYTVQHVPVNLSITIFLQVLIFIAAISTLATWFACRCIPRLPVSETLRFER